MISAPDIRPCTPPCPLPPNLVLAPAGFSPRTDVSPSCLRALLRVRFPITLISVHMPVLQGTHCWSGRPPTTQVQFTVLAIASIIKFSDAVDERALDVLAVSSVCSEPSCTKVVIYPYWLFPFSSPNVLYNQEE